MRDTQEEIRAIKVSMRGRFATSGSLGTKRGSCKTSNFEFNSTMQTLEQIEEEVKLLPAAEQKALLARLTNLVAKGGKLLSGTRQNQLSRFFAEWDASHSVTVGERPTRERTYADNPRLR